MSDPMIDWSGTWLQMKADVNTIYEHLNTGRIDEADEMLTEVIVNARLIRGFLNAAKEEQRG